MATKENKGKPVSNDTVPMHKKLAEGKPVETGGAKNGGGPKTRP